MFRKRLHVVWLLTLCLLAAPNSFAHPMGNFSVNHYARISLERDGIKVSYIIDLAEIPAYQELQQGNVTADVADPAVTRFVKARGTTLAQGLILLLNGKRVSLPLQSSTVIFPPGAGGLPTMKMGFVYKAAYPVSADRSSLRLQYRDENYPGHAGWKEVIAVAPGAGFISSSVPSADRSAALTNYPSDLLNSPPQVLTAALEFSAPLTTVRPLESHPAARKTHPVPLAPKALATTSPRVTRELSPAPLLLQANQQVTPRSRFTELMTSRSMSLWFLITAGCIALGLGAMHALEPGHGKTIVAAYLVGARGTAFHALLLGLIVTASHTVGVFALGAITLYASRYIVPEQLYPWLGVFSGLLIFALGGYMVLRRWSGLDVNHSHNAGGFHRDWFRGSTPDQTAPAVAEEGTSVPLYQLLVLGITGGIIPCPAALVVLLSAFALHRIGFGFYLIVAFSLGMATVLIGFGMLMVYGRRFMSRLRMDGPLTTRWLPVASAAVMTLLGAAISFRAFIATGISVHHLSKEKLGPFLFIAGVGLLLGMRHSTDADHVVAVSTIVSKQRSIRQAGLIGSIWGLGHTLTIFAVGSLIILFGVVIPPRLGLAMEFSVALMLILLGTLNLTGTMQRLTSYLTRSPKRELAATANVPTLLAGSVGSFGVYQYARPLVVGVVHGLAGSAAVALLVLSTIHSPLWATMYLLIFGAGTMVGMMCMTAAMAVPLVFAGNRFDGMSRFFSVASGVVSVCFGCFLVYQLGFLGGLFTSHPQWVPR